MEEDAFSEAAPAELPNTYDQKYLKEFIIVLETLPEVWDSSKAISINKVKRANAYEQLLQIFKKIKPGAKIKDVIAKINSLKSNYRKDLKKITDSKRSGAASEDVYNPKSWVFHMLKFLDKNEKPIDINAFSELDKSENEEEQSEPSFSSMGAPAPPSKKLKKKGLVARQNDLLEKACNYLSQSSHQPMSSTVSLPNIDPTALYWSQKLNKLKLTQRLLAKKAINEILFEAELGTLTRDSVQISVSPNSVYPQTPSPIYSYSNPVPLQSPQSVTSPENCVVAQTNDVPSFTQMYDRNVITTGMPSNNMIITNTNNVRRQRETSYTLHIPSTSSTYSDYNAGTFFSSYQGE